MENNNPKISFIPKNSLIREESFFERPRQKSAIGILALIAAFLSAISYSGLYYYDASLVKQIETKTIEIKNVQKEFGSAPEVAKARAFRSRVLLAQEILDTHILVSPVLIFLSDNTLTNIFYDKFSFSRDSKGIVLELSGQSPTYAALAYQAGVFRAKTKELVGFSVRDVTLTKFSTVSFVITMNFNPAFLSYTKNIQGTEASYSLPPSIEAPSVIATSSPQASSTPALFLKTPIIIKQSTSTPVFATTTHSVLATSSPVSVTPPSFVLSSTSVPLKQSAWSLFWLRFKFW